MQDAMERILHLLQGHPELVNAFKDFLPAHYAQKVNESGNQSCTAENDPAEDHTWKEALEGRFSKRDLHKMVQRRLIQWPQDVGLIAAQCAEHFLAEARMRRRTGQGAGVAEVSTQVSLVDTVSRGRISIAVRSSECTHIAAFDLEVHLATNRRKLEPAWACPLCGKRASMADLRLDSRIQEALQQVEGADGSNTATLLPDGTWQIQRGMSTADDHADVITILDSDEDP